MFYLPQDYANTEHLLVFQSVDEDGFLVDAQQMGFRILDSTGAAVFPGAGYEDVLNNEGHLSTGRYYAYDKTVNDQPWTVPSAQAAGTYTIEWQFQVTADDPVRTFAEKFEIVESATATSAEKGFFGTPYRTYISPSQVRDEGADKTLVTDHRLEKLIQDAQALVEERTRNVFRPLYRKLRFDGPEADRIFLGMALVGVEEVKRKNLAAISSTDLAVAFERTDQNHRFRPVPDHRRNPTIALASELGIFSGTRTMRSSGRFGVGRLNYSVTATFGFMESDGTVPSLIQEAMVRLVIATATLLAEPDSETSAFAAPGPLKRSKAGGYELEWNTSAGASQTLQTALARSRIIEEIFKQYRAPTMISAPKPLTAFAAVRL